MTEPNGTPGRKSAIKRQRLLEAGRRLVAQAGFSGVGLNDILVAAQIPKGSFYHYFGSKEAFGAAVLAFYVDEYAARLDGLLAQGGTGRAQLEHFWSAWIADPGRPDGAGWADDCLVVKLAAEVADLSGDMRQVLAAGVTRLIGRIAALIAMGQVDGSLPKGAEPTALAHMLYQLWLGAALLARLMKTRVPMEEAHATTMRMLDGAPAAR